MLVFLNGTFTILAFSGVMWSISPLLFAVAVGYAALGSGLTLVFGRPLLWLNYDQSDREASFRAELVHLRENAESVAVLRREGRIARAAAAPGRRAGRTNLKRIIAVNRNLGFFTTGYNYLIQVIPILIVAPLFIRGQAEFGVISQSSMAFSHLIGAFSLIVTQFQQISSYAVVHGAARARSARAWTGSRRSRRGSRSTSPAKSSRTSSSRCARRTTGACWSRTSPRACPPASARWSPGPTRPRSRCSARPPACGTRARAASCARPRTRSCS